MSPFTFQVLTTFFLNGVVLKSTIIYITFMSVSLEIKDASSDEVLGFRYTNKLEQKKYPLSGPGPGNFTVVIKNNLGKLTYCRLNNGKPVNFNFSNDYYQPVTFEVTLTDEAVVISIYNSILTHQNPIGQVGELIMDPILGVQLYNTDFYGSTSIGTFTMLFNELPPVNKTGTNGFIMSNDLFTNLKELTLTLH